MELSSPEFVAENKKNHILSDSLNESDIYGIEQDTMTSKMETANSLSAGTVGSGEHSSQPSQLTLRDEDFRQIASFMTESFKSQVTEITQASLKQFVTDLVNSIVSGVLSGLNSKIALLKEDNMQLQQRIQQTQTTQNKAAVEIVFVLLEFKSLIRKIPMK